MIITVVIINIVILVLFIVTFVFIIVLNISIGCTAVRGLSEFLLLLQMTWADMFYAEVLLWLEPLIGFTIDLSKYPLSKALQDAVHSQPVIAAYIKERWPAKEEQKAK